MWGDSARRKSGASKISPAEATPAAGMGTTTTLRRHFNRTVGVSPDTYRRTFRSRIGRPGVS